MSISTPDAARRPVRSPERTQSRDPSREIAIGVTLASALVFYAFTTHGTFNPLYEQAQAGFADRFFFAQASALVHGHLNISPSQIPGECFVYRNRCYGYFGLTPSLLRVPFLPLLNATNRSFTAVYMTIALTFAVGSALAIASHTLAYVRRTPFTVFLWTVLAVGMGPASVLVMVARPAVYEEAIAWSVAFALFGIYCFLRWWSVGGRTWAVLLVISLVLSTNARPTTLPLGAALGLGIVVRVLLQRRAAGQTLRPLLFAAVVAIVPVLTCIGSWWLKFRTPVPSVLLDQQIGGPGAAPWWLAIRRLNHSHLQGLRFIPTALVAYLRPDDVSFASAFPFLDIRFGPLAGTRFIGIPAGSMYIEPFSTITDDMPLAIAIVLAALIHGLRVVHSRRIELRLSLAALIRSPFTYCVLGTAASSAVMLSSGWLTNRYVADAFPLIVVAMAVSARFLAPVSLRLNRRGAIAVGTLALLLLGWSLLFDIGVEYQSWWHLAS